MKRRTLALPGEAGASQLFRDYLKPGDAAGVQQGFHHRGNNRKE